MKTPLQVKAVVTAIVLATGFAATADAKCALSKLPRFALGSHTLQGHVAKEAVRPEVPADPADPPPQAAEPTIAGLWNVQFLADGQVVDAGFDAWHADNTETLNDTTAPSAGNVCIGVWSKTGPFQYKLKHPSWIFDDAGVNLIGVVIIRETVTLAKGGDSFAGDVTIDVYDLSGNPLQHIDAKIQALRITTDDVPNQIGLPGFPAWPQMP